ncbi:four-carbon acid sugar kinase family protein, partial [Arthrobacter sp. 35/47]|uniref:four-carbon acid sugar kinase family protein n=1 Tax=Arthrobacter sp. 35/47 TaxID=269454 RepID=UPI00138AD473
MQPQPALGIVADDLTGANDTLVQFAEAGFNARLSLAAGARLSLAAGETSTVATAPPSATAYITDSRALDAAAARSRTGEAVKNLSRAGINRLYVKIDSTMRGSIAGQMAGALDAWGETHSDPFAVVCPAYPAMGRVVDGGQLLVHGRPVESSPAGTDPVTPVHTSTMTRLLPGATSVPRLSEIPPEKRAQTLISAARETAVVVVDAVTQSDLDVIATILQEIGPRAVPVGSAGLAGALAALSAV